MSYHKGITVIVSLPKQFTKFRTQLIRDIKAKLPGVSVRTRVVSDSIKPAILNVKLPSGHLMLAMRPDPKNGSKKYQSDAGNVAIVAVNEAIDELVASIPSVSNRRR